MTLSVSTIAQQRRLTSLVRVKEMLGLSVTTFDGLLQNLIDDATAAIERYCGWSRGFGRQLYSETLPGFGHILLQLGERPLVSVTSVVYNSETLTDYSISDRDRGLLYRQNGWPWTAQVMAGLTGWQQFPGTGIPMPGYEEPSFTVIFVAGYVLPSQHILAQTTISAADADNSFNDSAAGFPALLKAGDVIEVEGFTTAANNGRFAVSGTPTAAKVVVDATLTTEAAGDSVSIKFRNRPDCRSIDDIERAAIETVKAGYLARQDDPNIVEKSMGPARLRFSEQEDVQLLGVPASVVGLLKPWVRAA